MGFWVHVRRAALALAGWGLLCLPALADATVNSIRLGLNGETTRVVIDADQVIDAEAFTLADPYRLVIDLPEVRFGLPQSDGDAGRGLVERYRFGLFRSGVSRLVLDMEAPFQVARFFTLKPQGPYGYRLVFDLAPTDRRSFLRQANKRRREAAPDPRPRRASPLPRADAKRVVVVDAGHGGVDPGTLSAKGVPEKDVVLAIAKAVRDRLEATGRYEVVLTRDRDIFIDLRRRVAIARAANADLFISIHADALDNRSVRGATVYTLSERASDAEAAALAAKENKADVIAGIDLAEEEPEVTNILIDLAQRETMNFSASFAGLLVPQLRKRHVLRTNSHRFAGFIVLKAPDVPSILLETGYLSNAQDARLLTSPKGRANLANAVTEAVDAYFKQVALADY